MWTTDSLSSWGGRPLPPEIAALVEVEVKYGGYLAKEKKAAERFRRLEGMMLPKTGTTLRLRDFPREAKEAEPGRPRSLGRQPGSGQQPQT